MKLDVRQVNEEKALVRVSVVCFMHSKNDVKKFYHHLTDFHILNMVKDKEAYQNLVDENDYTKPLLKYEEFDLFHISKKNFCNMIRI